MDRRRVSTQSAGQDCPGTLKKCWPLSYNTFNKTRNHHSIAYNQRRSCPSRHNFPGFGQLKEPRIILKDVLMTDSGRQHLLHPKKGDCSNVENTDTSHAKHHTSATSELTDNCHEEIKTSHHDSQSNILSSSGMQPERKSECRIRKQNENSTRSKEDDTSSLRNSEKEVKGICKLKQTEKRDQLCERIKINESQCKIDLHKDTLTDSPLPSPKKKRLCAELQDHPIRREINRAACSQKENEDLLKKLLVCLTCKEQTENCHCFSNNAEGKDPLMEITKTESGLQQQPLSPLNMKQQSPNHKDQESVNNNHSTPDDDSNWRESLCTPVPNGQKTSALFLSLPTLNPQIKPLKPAVVSSEPIVLSSDDEDTDKMQSGLQYTTLTPEIKRLRLGSKPLSTDNFKKEAETHSAKWKPENVKPYTTEQDTGEMNEQNKLSDAVQSMDDSLETSTMAKPTLDLIFAALHMGEIEGNEQGSVMFGPDNIAINLSNITFTGCSTLLLDTSHLKKYSVWERLSDSIFENHSIIFLWFATDYIDEINKQLKLAPLKQDYKCSEYIFIQLFKPLQATETTILKKIMTLTGTRHEIADLCETMSLEETYQLLAKFDSEQSSFLSSCCKNLQQQVDTATLSQDYQLSQEENANSTRANNYTLCHIRRKDHYIVSLASKQEKQRHIFRRNGPVQKIIVFPPPPTKGGLAVTTEDLECLEEGEFLNDVIIDFYLKYLLLEKAPKELAERTHIFSSFFYRRLTRKDNAESEEVNNLSIQQKRHQRVKTWTRHVDIFTKDFIFVPINEESHWYLAVICFPGLDQIIYESDLTNEPKANRLLSNPSSIHSNSENISRDHISSPDETDGNTSQSVPSEDSEDKDSSTAPCVTPSTSPSPSTQECIKVPKNLHQQRERILKQPCILIMDSLRAASQLHTVKILREYLQIEWEVKKGGQRNFTADKMKGSVPRVPKQDNSSDCGIYLLQYVESFFQNPITNFDLPLQLDKWFLRQEVKKKREEIQDLILHLHNQQRTDTE
ncbi:sentrin-specific protease 7-like isoform X2 [Pristis pectinata]|uniref:sentrin-specific protease 7-like isoform X2 n=1 Tax=Pristis pectinata TaxID=685728 RepID=UPI00223E4212|nr:sentrin-specific protease 7-like isoform X2 [Pristis pectinata]